MYGFDDISLNFMSSYLNSRRQRTIVNGFKSDSSRVTYDIAQGSIIGPLIYILYANDVFQKINYPRAVLMYADDILVLSKGNTLNECVRSGQEMLNKITSWCDLNKSTINVKKTKSMFIKPGNERCDLKLYIYGECLDVVNSFEYLGIHIDHALSMNNHVDCIYKKCITKLGMLYKVHSFISKDTALCIKG